MGRALYAQPVGQLGSARRSPTRGLVLGLAITLAAVLVYSWYVTQQISSLRALQRQYVDRNRKDSLQLLRIQNDLNKVALTMRDMADRAQPYPLSSWSAQLQRLRTDLDDALRVESALAQPNRPPEQTTELQSSLAEFWNDVERVLALARQGKEHDARVQIRQALQPRQATLSTAVARLLIENNESEERTAALVSAIYSRVERQVFLFLAATLLAIVATSIHLIRTNRRLFARLEALSQQRSELAQKLIATQDSTLQHVSRELHDEFGQILTAVGSMLGRAGRYAPDSQTVAELREISEITQSALDQVRSLSQTLHPVILDEAGLENTLEWYLPTVERQTGLTIHYEKFGTTVTINGDQGIHIYRVLQEALNNVKRHSGAEEAWVRLRLLRDSVELEIEDHGAGLASGNHKRSIGLTAMRERAQLLGGKLDLLRPAEGGTLVRLLVPRSNGGEDNGSTGG